MLKIDQKILVIDDDLLDLQSIRRAFEKSGILNPIVHLENGIEALSWIKKIANEKPEEIPRVIFLDLNMPKMTGHEFLQELRSDPVLGKIMVFVLSTSSNPNDIVSAYKFNVAGFFIKSVDPDEFLELVSAIKNYLDICEFY